MRGMSRYRNITYLRRKILPRQILDKLCAREREREREKERERKKDVFQVHRTIKVDRYLSSFSQKVRKWLFWRFRIK